MSYLNFGPMLLYKVFILIFYIDVVILAVMPSFDRPSENLTVIIGNAALLPCFINNLGDHKVIFNTSYLNILCEISQYFKISYIQYFLRSFRGTGTRIKLT
jgi:hypothetical protein